MNPPRWTALLALLGAAHAFCPSPQTTTTTVSQTALFGGAKGGATSLEGKQKTVESVRELLDTSEMIFSMPATGLTVAESQMLRRSLPDSTSLKVVKNTLMKKALEGTEYADPTEPLLAGANAWFFIQDDIKGTISAYNSFVKETELDESHPILGGVLEGQMYDTQGVVAIGKLPSKQELYAKIAGAIKAVPTRVATVIKAPSSKLARAIQLATAEENKSE